MAEKQEQDQNLEVIMGLIMAGGNAKSSAFEAIRAAKKGDFDLADAKMKEANAALIDAHNVQTDMLTQEAQGNHAKVGLLTVHSQDHLMTAITFRDLAGEIIDLYKRLAAEGK
jgi:PTS system cellobiose-specific IIA component